MNRTVRWTYLVLSRRYSSQLSPNIKQPGHIVDFLKKSDWKSVVGLEVHVQIASLSKLFSGAKFEFSSPVNSCVSLFDAAIPGTRVVGLEVHIQIASLSKLFSGAKFEFSSPVNSCVSLFDAAIPGTLPSLNQKCVEAAILTSLALECNINLESRFHRKHYFYSDLPAGYQITQYDQPIAEYGQLKFNVFTPGIHKTPYEKVCKLRQVQLEQDSGKTIHDDFENRYLLILSL
ncbi:glutamyl-tRNA(Gln) amidotransferase subunit B, mitochondrial-like, partial [Diaphorina citri]|uniref:Glutamyl-tRNA(Gln) amidotransferase subunit B, mitochondrial-like n=1 Tax=Diaphorina citri TaxID=121845 RepID=A0A3Q0JJR0_DIACI